MARVCWIHQYSKTGNTEVSPLRTCWKSWSIGCVIQLFLPPGESWEVYLFVCLLYVPGDIGYGDCPLKLLSLISPVTRQLEYVSSCQHSKKHKPEASLLNNMQENCSAWCMVTFPSQSEAGIWVVFFLIIFCSGEQRNYGEQLSQISLLDSMWLVSHLLRVWEPLSQFLDFSPEESVFHYWTQIQWCVHGGKMTPGLPISSFLLTFI